MEWIIIKGPYSLGPQGDTTWRLKELQNSLSDFSHHELDIRDRSKILDLLRRIKPDAIVHTAAQPSHDKAASIPFDDFDVNAVGTLNLLEATRQFCTDSLLSICRPTRSTAMVPII